MTLALFLHAVCLALALPPTLACAYLGLLTLLSARLPVPAPGPKPLRFDILVPAHNEIAVIERTVANLRQVAWPDGCLRILVIADNCDDDTATLARRAGAEVIERHDSGRRGKGYALAHGIAHSAARGDCDAVLVIDADTVVSPNILQACAARIALGAEALQANYGVLNPDDSWRTRLVTIAYGAFHAVRSRGRERLRVSCGLRGNGMCFTHALLGRHPFAVYSLTEDIEYGVLLGLAGVRVWYVDEAAADAELLSSEHGSRSQRQRWEGGRLAVTRAYTGRLLAQALRRGDRVCLDLALDLLLMPLGYVALQTAVLACVAAAAAALLAAPGFAIWCAWAAWLALVLAAHVLRGWQLAPLGPAALLDLARAPFYVLWKVVLVLRRRRGAGWVKTSRDERP